MSLLESLGAIIQTKFIYRDHHYYTKKEIALIKKSLDWCDIIITTEKDFIRIKDLAFEEWMEKIFYIKIDLVWHQNRDLLFTKISELLSPEK